MTTATSPPLPVYLENLKRILKQLRKTGAKIIFATTTPTHSKKVNRPAPQGSRHYNSDIAKYNAAAIELMEKEGILINDLHPLLMDDLDRFIDSIDWIHPTADGIEVLSDQIAKMIKEVSTQ